MSYTRRAIERYRPLVGQRWTGNVLSEMSGTLTTNVESWITDVTYSLVFNEYNVVIQTNKIGTYRQSMDEFLAQHPEFNALLTPPA